MCEDRFGYNKNIPEDIRYVFMWLCQDLLSLQRLWDFYQELFKDEKDLALFTDYARNSFEIIEESLRTSIVMGICRLNDPSIQKKNENLSFERIVNYYQANTEINDLYTQFTNAYKPFEAYRNKRFGHRDLPTTVNYKENILPGIGKLYVDEVLRLAREIINAIAGEYLDTEYCFQSMFLGGAESLKMLFRKGVDSYKTW